MAAEWSVNISVFISNTDVVYMAFGNQIVVSTDGATTWSHAASLPGAVWAIAVSPIDPATIYAGTETDLDGFAVKLDLDGRNLLWSTFYTGGSGAAVNAVAPASSGSVWIAGSTSPGLPITPDTYSTSPGNGAAFLSRISDSSAGCAISLNPSSVTISHEAQTAGFTITAPSGCHWNATSSDGSWITVASGSSGTASGPVSVAIAANHTGLLRTGSVNVAGEPFTVVQAEASCTAGDGTAPVFRRVSANPAVLWPPDHKLVPVRIDAVVADNCDDAPLVKITKVTSNEPVNGLGDGDTAPDWEITGNLTLRLGGQNVPALARGGSTPSPSRRPTPPTTSQLRLRRYRSP